MGSIFFSHRVYRFFFLFLAFFSLSIFNNIKGCSFESDSSTTFTAGVLNNFLVNTSMQNPRISLIGELPSGVGLTSSSFDAPGLGEQTLWHLVGIPKSDSKPIYSIYLSAEGFDNNGKYCTIFQRFLLMIDIPPCIFTSPYSTIFKEEEAGRFEITVNANSGKSIEIVAGSLPIGLELSYTEGQAKAFLQGIPSVGTASCYKLTFEFIGEDGCTNLQEFELIVRKGEEANQCEVKPVRVPRAVQRTEVNQLGMRAKKPGQRKLLENVVKWSPPFDNANIVAYRLYADRDQKHLIGEVQSLGLKRFKYVQRDVKACRDFRYFIVSVDPYGHTSKAVKVKVKNAKQDCAAKKRRPFPRPQDSSLSSSS